LKERVATRLAQLSKDYRKYLLGKKLESLEPEYRLPYFVAIAKEGKYEELMDIIRKHTDEQDTVRAIQALTTIEEPKIFLNYLDEIKERKDLRANLIYAIMGATRNPKFRTNIWDWIDRNYEWLREIYSGSGYMSFMVESLISYSGIGNNQRVNDFLSKINRSEVKRGVDNGLEWLKIHENLVEEFKKIHN
jgi:aminopeptidase N